MKSKKIFLIGGLIIIFIFVRLINLDADLPPFNLMSFSGIDEFYYAICGFNLFHFGTLTSASMPLTDMDATPLALLLNFFQALTLNVFGNNYFGLRFGSGLCSFILFLFLIDCIKRTSLLWNNPLDESRKNNAFYLVIVLLLFFAIDYSFLMASRISEPGISRSLILVFLIWFVVSKDKMIQKNHYFFSFIFGLLALFSVCCVYLYDLFYVGASGLALLLISIKNRKSIYYIILNIFFFVLGGLVCCLLYEGFIHYFYDKSFLDYMGTIRYVSDMRVSSGSRDFLGIILRIKQLFLVDFGTNMFNLNLPFIVLTLLALPLYFHRTLKSKKSVDIFISCIIVFWFAQSYFENSYPIKRHTLMFPVFFLVLIYSFEEIPSFINYLSRSLVKKNAYIIYILFIIYSVYFISNNFFKKYSKDFPELVLFEKINIGCCIIAFLIIVIGIWYNKLDFKLMYYTAFLLIIPSCYLFFNKIVFNSSYKYKQAMVDIGNHVGDKIMVGGVSYGFRLYNPTKPALNLYMYQYHDKPELKKRIIMLLDSVDYTIMIPNRKAESDTTKVSPMEVGYLKEISEETNYTFKLEKLYNIGDRDVLLIKKNRK